MHKYKNVLQEFVRIFVSIADQEWPFLLILPAVDNKIMVIFLIKQHTNWNQSLDWVEIINNYHIQFGVNLTLPSK